MTLDDTTIASRLTASLPTTRWFADKAARIAAVTLHDRISLPGDATVELALADVRLTGHDAPARYALVVGPDGVDAAATPASARGLLDIMLAGATLAGRDGRFIGHRTGHVTAAACLVPDGEVTVSPLGGDASNTSLVVRSPAANWIIKLFRRCRTGIQPEVEVGDFFAAASWHGTPRLCGWLEYAAADASAAIATVHEFAPGCTTGWDRLVGLLTVAAGKSDGLAGAAGDTALALVAALGRTTGEMHRALASRPDLPAFAPEPVSAAGRQATAARMRGHAEQVFALIASKLTEFEPAIARRLAAVLAARAGLVRRFEDFSNVALSTNTIRVHGDYHLGQVLVAEHDNKSLVAEQCDKPLVAEHGVLVIDFEGEPGRSLAERREKTAAAKDVAGMCRSFDYLLRHVAKSTGRPYAAADLQRLEDCYLDAYREVAAGQPWWPADREAAGQLLAVFKLDKAIYELAYELNNRPDWIDVPLAAVEEAVATADRSHA